MNKRSISIQLLTVFTVFIIVLHISNAKTLLNKGLNGSDVECSLLLNQSVINCENVRCGAIMNFTGEGTQNYKNFAIGYVPNQENVDLAELVKFYLYPKIDQLYHQNYTVQIGFRFHRFSIYYAEHMFDDGFRISNLTCYSKLVDLFRSKKADRIIQTKSESYGVQNVTVFGQLNLF